MLYEPLALKIKYEPRRWGQKSKRTTSNCY